MNFFKSSQDSIFLILFFLFYLQVTNVQTMDLLPAFPDEQLLRVIDVVKQVSKVEQAMQAKQKAAQAEQATRVVNVVKELLRPCKTKRITLDVLQQWPNKFDPSVGNWVLKERGNCAYHALKNVVILLEILEKSSPDQPLDTQPLRDLRVYEELMNQQYYRIISSSYPPDQWSWLDAGQLEKLVGAMDLHYPILVVEHIPAVAWTEKLLEPLKEFAQSDHAMLGFLWNAGVRESLAVMGGTHWFGFVAVKKGKCVTLYYMNSAKFIDPNFDDVEEFIELTPSAIEMILRQAEEEAEAELRLSRLQAAPSA